MVRLAKLMTTKLVCLVALLGVLMVSGPDKSKAEPSTFDWSQVSDSSGTDLSAAINPADGKLIVDGIIFAESVADSMYVTFRDSDTANTSSEVAFVVWNNTVTLNSGALSRIVEFKRGIAFYNGLSTDASSCPSTSGHCYSVLYRKVTE